MNKNAGEIKKKMRKARVLVEKDSSASAGPVCGPAARAACGAASEVLARRRVQRCWDVLLFSAGAYGCGAETASSLAGVRVFWPWSQSLTTSWTRATIQLEPWRILALSCFRLIPD